MVRLACQILAYVLLIFCQFLSLPLEAASFRKPFVKGYQSFHKKDYPSALKSLGPLVAKAERQDFVLRDYALYAYGVGLIQMKRCAEALPILRSLLQEFPDSRWFDLAGGAMLQGGLCLGDLSLVESEVDLLLKREKSSSVKGAALLERARLYRKAGRESEAERDLLTLIKSYPTAAVSEQALILLGAGGGKGLSLAAALAKGGHCDRAEALYQRFGWPRGAMPDIAECYLESRRYAKAKLLYQKICGQTSLPCLAKLARAAARSDDAALAIETHQKIIRLFSKSREAREAEAKIPFLYEDSGQYGKAIPHLQKMLGQIARGQIALRDKASKKSDSGKQQERLLERLGWAYYREGQWQSALETLEEGSRRYEFNGFFDYWQGRVLEKMGQGRQAKIVYAQLIERMPATYYALRAIQKTDDTEVRHLIRWWNRSGVPQWDQNDAGLFPADSERLKKIQLLHAWGLEEDALVELRRFRRECESCTVYDPSLHRSTIRNEHPVYRMPFPEVVFSAARAFDLDPYLVYAMMRQESRFQEMARSRVGAKGLMQLMPFTAKRVAEKIGWDDFDSDQVVDPEVNIRLGVGYLKILGDYFNEPLFKVASYNAGEEAVKRWVASRPEHPIEEFIEEISYSETRDYVKKIYVNWKAYRFIYQ